jgi:hypothetical protein
MRVLKAILHVDFGLDLPDCTRPASAPIVSPARGK